MLSGATLVLMLALTSAPAGSVCLQAHGSAATIDAARFTLVWRHSIEKIDWEEDYVVAGEWLYLSGARVRGTGAGMDIPDDAQRVGAVYVYRPAQRWFKVLDLARSDFVEDYRVCIDGRCEPMARYVPVAAGTTHVSACGPLRPPVADGRRYRAVVRPASLAASAATSALHTAGVAS